MVVPWVAGAILLISGCQTQHTITVRADRSAFVRNSSTLTGLDIHRYANSPALLLMDTSVFGNSIVVIKDIDSLGHYLPTFDPHQVTISLRGNELSVHFHTAPILKGWSGSGLSFFVEQGIEKALPSKGKVTLESMSGAMHYASIRIRKKVLRTRPEDLDFTLLLRDTKR